MRKLATVQKIISLQPIPDKDKIELATVLGWQVIVEKGFKPGDLVIYCEIDSILPEVPEFEFLRSRCFLPKWKGHRIKTMKMCGIYSQGICFPLSLIKDGDYEEGDDVTSIVGVRKYDPESLIEFDFKDKKNRLNIFLRALIFIFPFLKVLFKNKYNTAPFPSFVHKTDETRIQNVPEILTDHSDILCYVTEKLDGQSATYAYNKGKFYVCSRNLQRIKPDKSTYWKIAERYFIKVLLKSLNKNIAIQGEIVGSSVQGNKYGLNGIEFYVYQVFDIDKQRYYDCTALLNFLKETPFKMVPMLGYRLLSDFKTVEDIVTYSKGYSVLNDTVLREGVVIRSVSNKPYGVKDLGLIFSFKVINPDFLLKYSEND